MLGINSIPSGSAAANYFGGSNADYFLGDKSPAFWHGQVAQRLGLSGQVEDKDFCNLPMPLQKTRASRSPFATQLTRPCTRSSETHA